MPSRRDFITVAVGMMSITTGCIGGDKYSSRCSSRGVGSDSQHLRSISLIRGDEEVSLGVLVSEQAVSEDTFHTVRIRNAAGDLISSIPLMENRNMSRLDPEDYNIFSDSGELYAVPLGSPPVHGEFTVTVLNSDDEQIATAQKRFNCYAKEEYLP